MSETKLNVIGEFSSGQSGNKAENAESFIYFTISAMLVTSFSIHHSLQQKLAKPPQYQ
ncbi:MAG: hypothetical protein ACI9O6_002706 [Glaciecola sp.]|jgi:hypothetical protein